jgi:acyl transferase domain-containing protein/NAD(P)-dependent dehydrogenase (short-subunit alcohol dehydrogenase family)
MPAQGAQRTKAERLIAIVGVGAILPGARNVSEFWQNILEGKDCVVEVPKDRWDPAIFYDSDPEAQDKSLGKNGGFILDLPFDIREFRIPPRTFASIDRSQKILLMAALEAIRDSGYDQKPFDRNRTAVILGNAAGRTETETAAAWRIQLQLFKEAIREKSLAAGCPRPGIEKMLGDFESRMLAGLPPLTEDTLPGLLRNVAVGRVASHFDLHGPSCVVDAACASGLAALDFAADGLSEREYDLAISGAFHASLGPEFFVGFSKYRGLSPDRVKPFDARGDGFVGGEGACVFVLKRLADAVRDQDRIYAVLRGIGSASDGREKGIGAPNPVAQALAIRRAFEQAGYSPRTVQLVETHGAGTPLGDLSEFEATREVFGCRKGERSLWLTAVKSQIGHLMGAAGAAGVLKTVLALYHKVLPQTINHVEPRKELAWEETGFRVLTRCEPWPENVEGLPRRGNVSSFGFGGINYHAALEEYAAPFHGRMISAVGGQTGTRQVSNDVRRREPIAVIGLGAALPQATGVDGVWEAITNRRSAIRLAPEDRWFGKGHFFGPESGAAGPKSASLLGGFIDFPAFDFRAFRIPPGTARSMDPMQKLFMQTALAALADAGYTTGRSFDRRRTAVLLGGAVGCQEALWAAQFRMNALRARYHLRNSEQAEILGLKGETLEKLLAEVEQELLNYPPFSEDTLLATCVQIGAARFAKALDLMGPHCQVDAACASSLASVALAVRGLQTGKWDMVLAGGISEGITPLSLVIFSAAGIVSNYGSRPFDSAADGLVQGEGTAVFVLKRLSDAFRDGDRIYAVIRGVGASSDGKGRSMMAPRSEGQALSLRRAYEDAGYGTETVDLVECHATSTAVGDSAEVEALREVFGTGKPGRVGIGSVKSQFGHLVGAAGAVGLLKAVLALHHKMLPPTINVSQPQPELRLEDSPFSLLTEPHPWRRATELPRRAGVSSFGFGGTNWHITLEELDADYHQKLVSQLDSAAEERDSSAVTIRPSGDVRPVVQSRPPSEPDPPLPSSRVFAFGAGSPEELRRDLDAFLAELSSDAVLHKGRFRRSDPEATVRLAVVATGARELREKIGLVYPRLAQAKTPPILEAQGIYLGRSEARGPGNAKLCFLFPGQGPQYPDMWRHLAGSYPEVKSTFDEANRTLLPLLGQRLEDLIFTRNGNFDEVEKQLLDSEVVQPALLTANIAMHRLLVARGLNPDLVAGHSLGEYSALVAAGVLDFASALRAVHVRGREFRRLSEGRQDPGLMAMITAPVREVRPVLSRVKGYAVVANVNCAIQTVISGASPSVREAVDLFERQGVECRLLPIAGAFHSAVARAIVPAMEEILDKLEYHAPQLPILSSVTGEYYAASDIRRQVITDLIGQLSGPVDFVGLINRLYEDGAHTYVEVGPKKALSGFVEDILSGKTHRALFSNHPKIGEMNQLNRLLAQLFVLGYPIDLNGSAVTQSKEMSEMKPATQGNDGKPAQLAAVGPRAENIAEQATGSGIVITGAAVGLPGRMYPVFSDEGIFRLLAGQSLIEPLSPAEQDLIVDKNITRVVKPDDGGESYFEKVENRAGAIKLAARRGQFQLSEFGLDQEWLKEADPTDQLGVAVGLEALRDAGIPLRRDFRKTSKGISIPNGWHLPESLQADTGVIFASVYSGMHTVLTEVSTYYQATLGPMAAEGVRAVYLKRLESARNATERLAADQWFSEEIRRLRLSPYEGPYRYNRELLKAFACKGNVLFAQLIKAQGPNLHMDSACASHIVALGLAEDMLRAGRARRVIVIAVDDVTSDPLLEWFGAGFLALGAAATDKEVCDAALPFDRRRHGLLLGMGASAIILETDSAARERGIDPIAELLGIHICNSAAHLTRLDPNHIAAEMKNFLGRMDSRHGLSRAELAAKTVFMSHETYTPARGGSAQAEVQALKAAFQDNWRQVLVANTKGMTGHCQAAGIEDVAALKSLQHGVVPPVVNFEEQEPELEGLNLSHGERRQMDFTLGFAAGFGSHVAMFLARAVCRGRERISDAEQHRRWLSEITGFDNPQTLVSNRTLHVEEGEAAAAGVPEEHRGEHLPGSLGIFSASPAKEVAETAPPASRRPVDAESVPVPLPAVQTRTLPGKSEIPDVQDMILTLFEEKTGYEREMLDFDLDLEADLGIDTIKQAQIFASIREKYNLPREEGIRLKDFPTLRHVIDYISRRAQSAGIQTGRGNVEEAAAPEVRSESAGEQTTGISVATDHPLVAPERISGPPPAGETPPPLDVRETVLALFEEKTGYEREMLDLDLDLEADLGIDTIKQAQIFASVRGKYNLPREEGIRLKDFPTLRHVIDYISRRAQSAGIQTGQGNAEKAAASEVRSESADGQTAEVVAGTDRPPVDPERISGPLAEAIEPAPPLPALSEAMSDEVRETILALVEEKTGYERQYLDLDLDLEADLGIDTIKQAQILALVREQYGLPREEGVRLKDFPTLRKVIEYINRRRRGAANESPSATETIILPQVPVKWSEIRRWTITAPPQTRVTGQRIQLSAGSLVLLTDDQAGIAAALRKRLSNLGVKVLLLTETDRVTGPNELHAEFEDPAALQLLLQEIRRREGLIDGLIHLLPLHRARSVDQMGLKEWRATTARETKSLLTLAKAVLGDSGSSRRRRVLAAVTGLGGRFGFPADHDTPGVLAGPPSQGAVAGFVKALSKEEPRLLAKVIDLDREAALRQPDTMAAAILEEILCGDPAVEVGLLRANRTVPQLSYDPVDLSGDPGIHLHRDSVLLLFGGARGITGAIAKDLARRFRCRLVLVGTSSLPSNPPAPAEFTDSDLARYRKQIVEELRRQDAKVTPARAEAALQKRLRAAEIYWTIETLRKDAADVRYEVCDVRDPDRMARLFNDLSSRFGRLDGVVFGAGVIEDKLLEDKSDESFSRVFDVKADGVFNLYRTLNAHPELKPSFVVTFSSVAGRFGNRGQIDYSAANELLAKFSHEISRLLPNASCFAIDWTAWSEVGLPARSGLADVMKEQGLDLISVDEGAEAFRNELFFGNGSEALYAGRLPGYTDIDASVSGADQLVEFPPDIAPLLDDVVEYHHGAQLRADKTIHPQSDPWLSDHVIDGVPLVPGVLGIEMMVEAARLLFPELHFVGIDDLRILLAVKILKNRPVTLRISGQAHSAPQPEERLVLVRMESDFVDPRGRRLGDTRLHYEATVILSRNRPSVKATLLSPQALVGADLELEKNDIYGKGKLLPHGPSFCVIERIQMFEDRSAVGLVAPVSEDVLSRAINGHRLSTLPLAREAGFQVAGLWGMLKPGFLSLPHGCRRLRHFGIPPENTRLLARSGNFKISGDTIECDLEILDENGTVYDQMEGYYAIPLGRISGF